MSDSTAVIKSLILFGIVLPLAILLGYMAVKLPDMDYFSMVVIGSVAGVISLPLLLKWHHQLLFLSWNAVAVVFFLPGRPEMWMFMAATSFLIMVFQRALSADIQMNPVPWMLAPLLFILAVVVGTAYMNGGIHLGSLGADSLGGRKYLYLIAAVLGFIAMTSVRIPENQAAFYIGAYFLGGLTNASAHMVHLGGSWLNFLLYIFPSQSGSMIFGSEESNLEVHGVARDFGLSFSCLAGVFFMLARFGLKNIFSGSHFRKLFFLVFLVGTVLGGFRSFLILTLMAAFFLFFLEGLHRSKFVILPMLGLVGILVTAPFANKMPDPIQRTLSFLPVNVSPQIRLEAEASTLWRVNMWKRVIPDIPRYFWLGKGCEANTLEFATTANFQSRNMGSGVDAQIMSGDYHNGPLSVLIPFGVWGMIGWLWFLAAGVRVLYLNHCYGSAHLRTANSFLFALFLARIVLFFFVFGAFETELAVFAGLVALGICLNGGVGRPGKAPQMTVRALKQQRKLPVRFAPGLLR